MSAEAVALDDLGRAARRIAEAQHVAVLTGAGVSAESGIPTFRGLGGLWRGRDPLSLATPEAFAAEPERVWEFYNGRRALVAQAEPNPAHHALAEMARRVPRLSLITQNVDRLHQRAGSRDVLELHGNLCEVRCSTCGQTSDRSGEVLTSLPRCPDCGGLLRPAVVWFGEMLPPDPWARAVAAVRAADVLLVVGTSAVVYPAASLITLARGTVIEVNVEPTAASARGGIGLSGKAGEVLPQLLSSQTR